MPGARAVSKPFDPTQWIPLFRRATPKTRFVTLSPSILSALLSNKLILPQSDAVAWSDGTTADSSTIPTPGVENALAEIDARICQLNGAVLPKLGSKAPSDATWANVNRSMKCASGVEVLELLQASERAVGADGGTLILRQWADIDQRREYRCFVRGGVIVGICTRAEMHVEYSESQMDSIVSRIQVFHMADIAEVFSDDYVVDVYMDGRDRLWVVDFSEWGVGDPLLFSWDELGHLQGERAQLRCGVHVGVSASNTVLDGLPLELREGNMNDYVEAARTLMHNESLASDQ